MIVGTQGHWFLDDRGRRLLLRGVNLGGDSKLPRVPDGATYWPFDHDSHRTVSFVGRPFALQDADEHYRRLRDWGFNCLRFLTTWEAIEHAGPGEYDEAYLDHLAAVVGRAADYGLHVFIDPHQDVWSRLTGGDGAPAWTLELAGFDPTRLDVSEAALTMQNRYPDYGTMVWSSNRRRLAAATMFTLFFAGDRFAPHLRVASEGIQDYLQRHFIGAMTAVAERLRDMDHVIGYDSLNEPSAGYIGLRSLSAPWPPSNHGPVLSGFETMILGAGHPVHAPLQRREGTELIITSHATLNPDRVSAWLSPERDVWRAAGVWDEDGAGRPVLLRDDYFAGASFFADHLRPFARRYAEAIRAVDPDAILFIEGEPHSGEAPVWDGAGPIVNAGHWYDSLTNRTKQFDPERAIDTVSGAIIHGREAVRAAFAEQVGALVEQSRRHLGGAPTLIGEFGVPMDLNGGAAYHSGDWSAQETALAMYYDALDAHLAHGTLWNYTATNRRPWGDGWNGEDFSIYSAEMACGSRAERAFCRPTVRACAGTPLCQSFDLLTGEYRLEIDATGMGETVIFIPRLHYPDVPPTQTSSGRVEIDMNAQQLTWADAAAGRQSLHLTRL